MQPLGVLAISLTMLIFSSTPALASAMPNNLPASIEANAMSLVDAVLANDAATIHQRYALLQEQVDLLHASLAEEKFDERRTREVTMIHAWSQLVKINLDNRSMLGAAIAANQLSSEMIRFQQSRSQKNWDAHWLAYLGRELALLVMESPTDNAELLDSRRSDAMNTWQRLRQEIIKNFRNKPMVEEGDQLLDGITAKPDQAQTITLGRKLAALMQKVIDSTR